MSKTKKLIKIMTFPPSAIFVLDNKMDLTFCVFFR